MLQQLKTNFLSPWPSFNFNITRTYGFEREHLRPKIYICIYIHICVHMLYTFSICLHSSSYPRCLVLFSPKRSPFFLGVLSVTADHERHSPQQRPTSPLGGGGGGMLVSGSGGRGRGRKGEAGLCVECVVTRDLQNFAGKLQRSRQLFQTVEGRSSAFESALSPIQ